MKLIECEALRGINGPVIFETVDNYVSSSWSSEDSAIDIVMNDYFERMYSYDGILTEV